MPVYCYETKAGGKVVEKVFPIGQAPRTIFIGNKIAYRSFAAESVGVPAKQGWPMTCFASGVNANQADELRTHLKDAGVPTEVTPDGDPVYKSAAHRKKALASRGMHDKQSYI